MRNKRISIVIISIIVVVILGGYVFWIRENQTPNVPKEGENSRQEEYNLMDMDNTNNVKIENKVKENTSPAFLKERTVLGMRIFNVRLVGEGGLTTFTADVENTSGNDFVGRNIFIIFQYQDGSEYARLEAVLPDIPDGQSSKIDASITADISNAYDFVIE